MIMPPRVRKLVLIVHVTSSVGWLGAIVVFIVLAVVGLTSQEAQLVRAIYLAAEPIASFAIVPFAVASLLTGLVSSLGTTWGLFRHYWVIFKLLINIFATGVLLMYTQTVSYFARVATESDADLKDLRPSSFVLHSGGALFLLLVAMVLAVYKPRGLTRYGQLRLHNDRRLLVS